MDATIYGLSAFSYAWNRERDNKCSKIKAFARAVKVIPFGIKVTPENLRSMQQDHPKSIFARSIGRNRTLRDLLYCEESLQQSSIMKPDVPGISELQQIPVKIRKSEQTTPLEKFDQLPEPGNITAIESYTYDSKNKENKTVFYNHFGDYVFNGKDIYSMQIMNPFEEMQSKGKEANHYKLSGRGGVVDDRHFVEVILDNGYSCLMYRSTGTSTSSESQGEWVPCPGWKENTNKELWFIKYNNFDGSDPKINKYNITVYQHIAAFLKDRELALFPDLNKKDSSFDG